ncbi:unnamed protein product, partial [Arabidopsis halleri]
KAQNHLSVIEDEQGIEHCEDAQIAETVAGFYQKLFTIASTNQIRVVEEAI